jgi:hypothetical protein
LKTPVSCEVIVRCMRYYYHYWSSYCLLCKNLIEFWPLLFLSLKKLPVKYFLISSIKNDCDQATFGCEEKRGEYKYKYYSKTMMSFSHNIKVIAVGYYRVLYMYVITTRSPLLFYIHHIAYCIRSEYDSDVLGLLRSAWIW